MPSFFHSIVKSVVFHTSSKKEEYSSPSMQTLTNRKRALLQQDLETTTQSHNNSINNNIDYNNKLLANVATATTANISNNKHDKQQIQRQNNDKTNKKRQIWKMVLTYIITKLNRIWHSKQISHVLLKACCIILTIILPSICILQYAIQIWFGDGHSIRGGKLGSLHDRWGQKGMLRHSRAYWKRYYPFTVHYEYSRNRFFSFNSEVNIDLYPNAFGEKLERLVDYYKSSLSSVHDTNCHGTNNNDNALLCYKKIPPFIFRSPLDHFHLTSQISTKDEQHYGDLEHVLFTDGYIRRLLHEVSSLSTIGGGYDNKPLLPLYDALSFYHKQLLFGIVSIYFYGGIFVQSDLASNIKLVEQNRKNVLSKKKNASSSSANTLYILQNVDQGDMLLSLQFLIGTPRHPILFDFIEKLPFRDIDAFMKNTFHYTYFESLLYESSQHYSNNINQQSTTYSILIQSCHRCSDSSSSVIDTNCCSLILPSNQPLLLYRLPSSSSKSTSLNPIPVSIQNSPKILTNYTVPRVKMKQPLHQVLRDKRCEPSWLCNRCLRYAKRGTYTKCSSFCSSCFVDTMCSPPPKPIIIPLLLSIDTTILRHQQLASSSSSTQQTQQRIPKIIHQTWFESLTPDKYPNLIRIQNSWRAVGNGYEYKFYDDTSARLFIQNNFPPSFLEAYETLLPGAFKADLFRYLVLLIHGGIYADIDLMLETSLDTLLSSSTGNNLTFVVARDTPAAYQNQYFCLWNGFLATTPAHPIIISIVERVMYIIQTRADILNIEQNICSLLGKDNTDIWKIRYEPGLLLTGPCALGVAFNEAVKQPNLLHSFPLGISYFPTIDATVHFLSFQKHDLGYMRILDTERNIIVATTDLVSMKALSTLSKRDHYSKAADGPWVYASRFVYKDYYVKNEMFDIQVREVS